MTRSRSKLDPVFGELDEASFLSPRRFKVKFGTLNLITTPGNTESDNMAVTENERIILHRIAGPRAGLVYESAMFGARAEDFLAAVLSVTGISLSYHEMRSQLLLPLYLLTSLALPTWKLQDQVTAFSLAQKQETS